MKKHVLDFESIDFLIKARNETGEIKQLSDLLKAPRDFANRYAIQLSSNVEKQLLELGEINKRENFKPDDPINIEAISFYNKVLIDGRYIKEWTENPKKVAEKLKIDVSKEVIKRIEDIKINKLVDTDFIDNPCAINQTASSVVIGIIIVIILVFVSSTDAFNIQNIVVDPRTKDKV